MTELQKLEEQVAELQATIERMKEPEPIKQWEPQGGEWYVDFEGINQCMPTYESGLFGVEYKTEQQAEWARDQMRRFNRLLAYVAEFDVDENGVQWMPDWNSITQYKYSIVYNHDLSEWFCDVWSTRQDITVYMSEQCAENLVDKLNSGSVML